MPTFEPRTAVVTVYAGDYLDRIRHLERQIEALRDAQDDDSPRALGDDDRYQALRADRDALVAEAEGTAVQVKLRALGRREWKALVAEHPARQGNESDARLGVNEDTFMEALVPASIVEPELTSEDLDELSDVDFERVYLTAFALNRSAPADPKASRV